MHPMTGGGSFSQGLSPKHVNIQSLQRMQTRMPKINLWYGTHRLFIYAEAWGKIWASDENLTTTTLNQFS